MSGRKQGKAKGGKGQKPKPTKKQSKPQRKRKVNVMGMGRKPQVGVAAAYATGQTSRNPRVTRSGVDSTRIIHRELISSVTGSVGFTVSNTFSVNPGLAATFPWLSTQALGWEKYKFNGLRLCYYTRTGSNTPGSVILTPDYDAADAAPVTEQIASAYHGTQEDVAWKDNCMIFDQKILGQERFIRTGGLAANLDIKTYDIANVFVSTLDGTAVNWGKLWLEYDITLINQQLNATGPGGSGMLVGNTAQTAAAPYGTGALSTGSFNLSASGLVVTATGLNINSEYQFFQGLVGTVITGLTLASQTGCTLKSTILGSNVINAAATAAGDSFTFVPSASTVTFTFTLAATTITQAVFTMTAIIPTASL